MEDVHEKKEFNNEKAECSAHLSDNDAQRGGCQFRQLLQS